ncbi:MAG: shikimate dehydrogenase [Alphaproteobacteria bacterium]|nr:shikimate dehydrogenase [Alphaproteobacteria bacterium]
MTGNKNLKPPVLIAGVVGWPIDHSLSPRLHQYWLKKYGINGEYQAYKVKPENLAGFLTTLSQKNIIGLNLTVPHKESVFPFLDAIDEAARKIGAVNMISVRGDKLYGSNSDGYGFMANLQEKAPHWSAGQGPVVILGAGGAARAVTVSLLAHGVPAIRLLNRSRPRAEKLAEKLAEIYPDTAIKVCDWQHRSQELSAASLLVNTTLLGMTGQPPLAIALTGLPREAVVYDIVYNPLETALLKQARVQGNCAIDGLGMLLHQAVPAFQAWFGRRVRVTEELRDYMISGSGL